MRIGRLFALSMLSVTALAVVLGAQILVPQYRTFAGKGEAITAVEAYGTLLAVSEKVAGYRAPYSNPMYQEAPATPAQRDNVAKAVQAADAAFARARAAIGGLNDSAAIAAGLDKAQAKLTDLRAAGDRALALPLSGRDQVVVKGFAAGISEAIGMVEPLLNRLETRVAAADASLTALLSVARTAQDLRVSAGGRAGTLSPAISARRPLTVAEISTLDRAAGRVDLGRERIEAGVDQIGSPRLVKALGVATEAYFAKAGPWLDTQIALGRTGANYTIVPDDLSATIVPAVQSFFAVRDASLAEAAERAGEARASALTMLALAGLIVVALLGVLAGVTVMLRRRVIIPLGNLTGVIGELAAGRHEVAVPTIERNDEIGAMAGSLQVFKDALIANKAADAAAAVEADAKIQRGQRVDAITNAFEAMIGEIVEVVASASTALESSAGTLTATAERSQQLTIAVASASEQASTNVQSVASATEQMASSVNEISRQVQGSARIANEAVAQAQRTNGRVAELAKAAARIGDVVELINTIAGQTNLLALNATIEAARAGEAGRGFAVVASEVKALAEQTAKATGEISQQISGIQAATQESVGAIQEIGATIGRMAEIATTIASAVEQQGAATQEISRNVQQAAHGTQQVSANIGDVQRGASETGSASTQVLTAAKSLSGESERLKREVGKFLGSVRAA
jgi:methyl-accepting chemotaxis protein